MKVPTSRFGELDLSDDSILTMTKPVLGFENLRQYALVETAEFAPFKWLQSLEDPEIAFVVVDPALFFPDYAVEVNPKEIEELEVVNPEDVSIYTIITIPADHSRMTANLQGPILINTQTNLAKQLVLVNSRYRIRHRLIEKAVTVETPEEVLV